MSAVYARRIVVTALNLALSWSLCLFLLLFLTGMVTLALGYWHPFIASLLKPGASLSSSIANEFNKAVQLHRPALITLGVLLSVASSILVLIGRLVLRPLVLRSLSCQGGR